MALFLKSAAKLLQQTAKTCQYLKKIAKKVHFFSRDGAPCQLFQESSQLF
jgi:hypothetical protein